jgi:8-oxo-dGTP pyrophosphatase MutT (NUDIX family)
MNFNDFTIHLKNSLQGGLPGIKSHEKLMPETRKHELKQHSSKNSKKSAVLMLFYPVNDNPYTVLIKRAVDGGIHSNQISMPGGQYEKGDLTLQNTALRESNEEININRDKVEIIGSLSKVYIPPSNFDMFPFIGITNEIPHFKANEEVEKILQVDIKTILNPQTFQYKKIKYRTGKLIDVPCYFINNEIIWGATAMVISEFIDLIKKVPFR